MTELFPQPAGRFAERARYRRRGDRAKMPFAAGRKSGSGTELPIPVSALRSLTGVKRTTLT